MLPLRMILPSFPKAGQPVSLELLKSSKRRHSDKQNPSPLQKSTEAPPALGRPLPSENPPSSELSASSQGCRRLPGGEGGPFPVRPSHHGCGSSRDLPISPHSRGKVQGHRGAAPPQPETPTPVRPAAKSPSRRLLIGPVGAQCIQAKGPGH